MVTAPLVAARFLLNVTSSIPRLLLHVGLTLFAFVSVLVEFSCTAPFTHGQLQKQRLLFHHQVSYIP